MFAVVARIQLIVSTWTVLKHFHRYNFVNHQIDEIILYVRPANWSPWYLRDWSRSGGSYGNNTRVICWRQPNVINPDDNMTKQRCMKRIYDKIRPKSPPNRATSPTCLHYDVTQLSLTTGVALHIPWWRIEEREERRQARKIVWPVKAGRVICRYQNNLCGIINHHKHIRYCFLDV